MTPTVALIGAGGHGLWHRRRIAPLHEAGRLRLVAMCDVAEVVPAQGAPIPDGVRLFADHRAMLRDLTPDAVVVCTPPHTHLPIAVEAARAGADVLLEKPPVLSLHEHDALARVLDETGRSCQVGFQALGSMALAELIAAIAAGKLGEVTAVSAAGAWQRDDAYFARTPWAGKRSLNGRLALDGALANPFAHAVMQCLAIAAAAGPDAGEGPALVEVERYRNRPIEVDDTACLRITLHSGVTILIAVTLCGEDFVPGEILVRGTAGTAELEYPTDRLRLPGEPTARTVSGRIGLLENLLDHRADPRAVPLLAPLVRTSGFTAVIEAIQAAPPVPIEPALVVRSGGTITVPGVNSAVRRAAQRSALFSELDVAWAAPPHRVAPGGTP